jgi:hypothetical protein
MSSINTGSININYPVPGQNNNTQGFRDNFSGIKNNLDIAANELTDLQNKVIVKSPLNGIALSNDMNNTLITNALTQSFRRTTFNLGNNLSGNITVDFTNGDFQYGTLTGNISLGFSKWPPTGTHAEIVVSLSVAASTGYTITLPSQIDNSKLTLENYLSNTISSAANVTYVEFVVSTEDCGTTLTITPVNRPRKSTQLINDPPSSNIGRPGDRPGAVAVDNNYIYVCFGTYNGTSVIWKRAALSVW